MDNRVWVKDAVMTIRLPEEVDHFVADRLREEAGEILVERNVREVVFDFRKTVFMDSSGIGLVMGRFREMELIGGKVRAVHVGERMRRILVMSGVTPIRPWMPPLPTRKPDFTSSMISITPYLVQSSRARRT